MTSAREIISRWTRAETHRSSLTTALANLIDIGYVKSTGNSVKIRLPKTATKPEWSSSGKFQNGAMPSNATGAFVLPAYAAAVGLYCVEQAMKEVLAGRTQTFTPFKVPEEAIGCGFHEAVRACCRITW